MAFQTASIPAAEPPFGHRPRPGTTMRASRVWLQSSVSTTANAGTATTIRAEAAQLSGFAMPDSDPTARRSDGAAVLAQKTTRVAQTTAMTSAKCCQTVMHEATQTLQLPARESEVNSFVFRYADQLPSVGVHTRGSRLQHRRLQSLAAGLQSVVSSGMQVQDSRAASTSEAGVQAQTEDEGSLWHDSIEAEGVSSGRTNRACGRYHESQMPDSLLQQGCRRSQNPRQHCCAAFHQRTCEPGQCRHLASNLLEELP